MGAKIGYLCGARDHQPGQAKPDRPDKLTIVNGEWAFCPAGAQTDHHEWNATGGQDLSDVMRQSHSIPKPDTEARDGRRA